MLLHPADGDTALLYRIGASVTPDPDTIRIAASQHRDRASLALSVGLTPGQLRHSMQRNPEIRNALHLGDADRLARDFYLCAAIAAGSYGCF
jgi:hypothetical protein